MLSGVSWWVVLGIGATPAALLFGIQLANGTTSIEWASLASCIRRTVACAAFAFTALYLLAAAGLGYGWSGGNPWFVAYLPLGLLAWPFADVGHRRHQDVRWLLAYWVVVALSLVLIGAAAA
jgi:formate hydrogenlyase subunit 3/multisubunit Na+/H+ antiporter MnhD subunit